MVWCGVVTQDDEEEDEEEEDEEEDEEKRAADQDTFCLCHRPSYGEMIACDNEKCKVRRGVACQRLSALDAAVGARVSVSAVLCRTVG